MQYFWDEHDRVSESNQDHGESRHCHGIATTVSVHQGHEHTMKVESDIIDASLRFKGVL